MSTTSIDISVYLDTPTEEVQFEANLEVEYDYEPGQPEILHPADQAQEGFPESITITSIKLSTTELADLFDLEDLQQYIFDQRSDPSDDEPY